MALALVPGAGYSGQLNGSNNSEHSESSMVVAMSSFPKKRYAPPSMLSFTNSIGMTFNYIEPGRFLMGSDNGDRNEKPAHEVIITKGFYMQTTEVTRGQWYSIDRTCPWHYNRETFYVFPDYIDGDKLPAMVISWNDAQDYISMLNLNDRSMNYRLPTEAEWEYACRAGSTTAYSFGDDAGDLGKYAWYNKNTHHAGEGYVHAVAQKKPNAWGLYDMHGNAYEWCQDWVGSFSWFPVTDPTGPSSGQSRVIKGGNIDFSGWNCRSANRFGLGPRAKKPFMGFRLVAVPVEQD